MCSYFVRRRNEVSRACSIMKNFVMIYVVYLLLLGESYEDWLGWIDDLDEQVRKYVQNFGQEMSWK